MQVGQRPEEPIAPQRTHPWKQKSATAGWQGIKRPVRSHQPGQPRSGCPWRIAQALSRSGGWPPCAESLTHGPRCSSAPRVIGASRRGPRRGMDGPRCRRRPLWEPSLAHALANLRGRPAPCPSRGRPPTCPAMGRVGREAHCRP
jgi:hypothetical protein